MKKLAVFVEGQTEMLFMEKLLEEIAGKNKIRFDKRHSIQKKLIRQGVSSDHPEQKYYVLLVNSGSDNRVISDIIENYSSLIKENYESIIGVRDVHPTPRADLKKVETYLYRYIKTKPIHPLIILSVMEIEAWFMAEHTHFEKMHPDLTNIKIKSVFGYDPSVDDMSQIQNPADDLDKIYQMVGFTYKKRRKNTERTINKLDYERLYLHLDTRIRYLAKLNGAINDFLQIT